ncbi:MAG TPA: serine/threonine-protein kinase [Planctomycetaceae bacterium]|nr:serine/threonine-protein kinase [Planctomycetaceae bacterium]
MTAPRDPTPGSEITQEWSAPGFLRPKPAPAETVDVTVELDSATVDCGPPASRDPATTASAGDAADHGAAAGDPAASDDVAGTRFGDYELLQEIARGGMGVVYKARQLGLNRIVALKMILGGRLASREDVERFYAEAEAAASLDHSGIVPVYEVGEHAGRHFFSMGYVEGASLAARIAEGPLAPRPAAELVAAVADAVEYAHERGVIHRDLKPGNVLLAQVEGRESSVGSRKRTDKWPAADPPLSTLDSALSTPRVTDFGLAKRIQADSHLTATGQVLGTPSYMPPEQAAGDMSRVDRQSDVYSLGAILYATLTGRPPFQAATVIETLRQVIEREPVPPRQLNPAVDRDLETICLKCLAKEPHRRYATARELGDDLRRFLTGAPILARPVSRVEAGWRWCRRNPWIAIPTAAFLISTLIGLAATSYFAVESGRRAADAAREADRAGRLFDEGRRLAQWVVFEFTDEIGRLRGSTQAQEALASQISTYLDRLSLQAGDDRGLASDIAAAYERVAAVQGNPNHFNLGRTSDALATYRKALALRERIVRASPDDLDARVALVVVRGHVADLLAATGQPDEAGATYRSLLDELAALERRHPGARRVRLLRIPLVARLGDLLAARGELRGALEQQREALRLSEEMFGSRPADDLHRSLIATAHGWVGKAHQALGELAAAREHYDQALAFAETAAAADRLDRRAERQLIESLIAFGDLLADEGGHDRALEAYRRAVDLLRRHRRADPNTASVARQLVVALERTATILQVLEDVPGMQQHLSEALELTLALAESDPGDVENLRNVLVVRGKYGTALMMGRRWDDADDQFREQLALARSLAGKHPDTVTSLQGVAESWDNLGNIAVARPGPESTESETLDALREAVRCYAESLAAFDRLAEVAPLTPSQQKLRRAVETKLASVKQALRQLTTQELSLRGSQNGDRHR